MRMGSMGAMPETPVRRRRLSALFAIDIAAQVVRILDQACACAGEKPPLRCAVLVLEVRYASHGPCDGPS